MKLFRVTYGGETFVYAESRDEAMRFVDRELRGEDFEVGADAAQEVSDIRTVPAVWRDAEPYGSDDRTVREILESK